MLLLTGVQLQDLLQDHKELCLHCSSYWFQHLWFRKLKQTTLIPIN